VGAIRKIVTREIELALAIVVGALIIAGGVVATDIGASSPENTAATEFPSNEASSHPPTADGRRIAIGADGEAEAEPDAAKIRLSIEATAADPGTARDRVADNVSRMRKALSDSGVSEDAIQTTGFDVHRDYRRRRPREEQDDPEIRYRAEHDFRIETSLDQAGRVTDTALDNGASTVRDVRFTLTTETQRAVRQAALEDAMSNARGQAQTLAQQSNLSITGVQTVSTGGVDVQEPRYDRAMDTPAPTESAGRSGTRLESGPVTVRVSVDVTYSAQESSAN
jgi:uncharacterized protein YggE